MQRTAQAAYLSKGCTLLWRRKLWQVVLAKLAFHRRGVLCSVSSDGIGYSAVCQILCKFVGPASWVGIEIFLNFKLRTTA